MSEMLLPTAEAVRHLAGNCPLPPWQTLRLLIHPAHTNKLIVSLVVQPKTGHPQLHHGLRAREVEWFPSYHQDDLMAHALNCAFLEVAQTQL